jgi:hypothetical protein
MPVFLTDLALRGRIGRGGGGAVREVALVVFGIGLSAHGVVSRGFLASE